MEALIKVVLPAMFRHLRFQPANLLSTFWCKGVQKLVNLEFAPIDAPKYVKGNCITEQPKMSAQDCITILFTPLAYKALLLKFILSPVKS